MRAVRWARRYLQRLMVWDYTKWHATEDDNWTICKIIIPIAIVGGTFFPEVDDDLWLRLDCKRCIALLKSLSEYG